MTALRIGVLGASRIADRAIVGPARELGHRIVAVAARDRQRAIRFAQTHGVERVLSSYDAVITDPDVDVVYNPLANSLHAPWNLKAIEAGKPVLTEKPFARDVVEATAVRKAAGERGIPIMEGFHYAFHPIMRRMMGLLEDGTLGTLQRADVVMRMPEPKSDDPRWSLELVGGAVMDLGCYGLHAQRQLAPYAQGAPNITAARAIERSPGVDESCDIDLTFPSGAQGTIVSSMTWPRFEMTLRLTGDRGEAVAHDYLLQGNDDRITVTTGTGTTVEHLGTRSTYTYQLDAFASSLLQGRPLPLTVDDAVENMRYVDETYRIAGIDRTGSRTRSRADPVS